MRESAMLSTPRTNLADWRDFLAVRLDLNSPRPSTLVPRLDIKLVEVPFATWWESDSVTNAAGTSVSRRRLVRGAADKDGGAHVDPKVDRFYEELMKGEWSLGITGDMTYGPPPFEQGVTHYSSNGHLALLRQFAHEVLSTAGHFGWVTWRFPPCEAARPRPPRPAGTAGPGTSGSSGSGPSASVNSPASYRGFGAHDGRRRVMDNGV